MDCAKASGSGTIFIIKKMKFRLLFYILLIGFSLTISAQRKQIDQAQDIVKSGKDLGKAESMMRKLLSNPAQKENKRIWLTLISSLTAQYAQGNEKLYLKQKYDTAAFFSLTKKLFDDILKFDSIDAKPDKKGRVSPRYRERHADYLDVIRRNLYYGGAYYVRKGKYNTAEDYLGQYIACKDMPMFAKFKYEETDSILPSAAYWMMYCGRMQNEYDTVFEYEKLARRDSSHIDYQLQYLAEAYIENKDTTNYLNILREGFYGNIHFPYFFPRLIDYYNRYEMLDSAMTFVDYALARDSSNVLFRTAKGTILLNQRKYNECIRESESLIAENDSLADAYYNIGLAYFDQAIELDKEKQKYKTKRRKMIQLYEKSLPYLERYRVLEPEKVDKWSLPLYTIYLNLNKGKEFDEIDRIRNEYRRKNK